MYLSRELTDSSFPRIGEFFGGRDHTTVMHAHQKIGTQRGIDSRVDQVILDVMQRIESL